jgi:phosphoribosylaminoimidazolecarboxamide formyltransferase/IMP cyclohydrolase
MPHSRRLALLSVTDKSGIVELGRGLAKNGFELLSTGGTAKALREAGLAVTEVGDFTGFPEILGGRVKTLQAKLLGGVLARTDVASDRADLAAHAIPPIDVVVVNLYRFADAAAKFEQAHGGAVLGLTQPAMAHVIEEIDIGGPTVIRAACKNSARVTVVVDPVDYPRVITATANGESAPEPLRAELTAKAFRIIARYDREISEFFDKHVAPPSPASAPPSTSVPSGALPAEAATLLQGDLPPSFAPLLAEGSAPGVPGEGLRYGENPHQKAFFLRGRAPGEASVLHVRVLMGKQLSYNNLLDADSALELVKEFEERSAADPRGGAPAAAAIIKHNNPCGCAVADSIADAFERAWSGDPQSAFGGILALNRPVDAALARRIAVPERFLEVLIAPEIAADALAALRDGAAWGKNLRVLACGPTGARAADAPRLTVRSLVGGVLVQERDHEPPFTPACVTRRKPTPAEERDLAVAWKIVKHVRSNAIVLVKDGVLVGTGAGQMSRVDSVDIAVKKAGARARGASLGSDAFFPFRDGLDAAAKAGVVAVIQPGGSKRDPEVVQAADEHGVAMVVTGVRHFRH